MLALGVGLAAITGQAHALMDSAIVVNLEEPSVNFPSTGISNLRGWAVGPNGINRIELLVDGNYLLDIPYGGLRLDVANRYPEFPDANASGYSMAFNYGNLAPGEHTFTVRARDPFGEYNETTAKVHVEGFAEPFYPEPDAFDLSNADALIDGNSVLVYHAGLGDSYYNLSLHWHVPSQKPALFGIEPFDLATMSGAAGIWNVTATEDATACGGTVTTQRGLIKVTTKADVIRLFETDFTFSKMHQQPAAIELTGTQSYTNALGATQVQWRILVGTDGTLSGIGDWTRGTCSGQTLIEGEQQ